MNYPESKKDSLYFTDSDKETIIIENNRGYGNISDDTNPKPTIDSNELILTEMFQY